MNSVSASAVRGMQERLSSDYLLFFSLLRDSYEHGSPMHRHAENAIQRVQQSLRLTGRLLGAGGTEITPVEVENLESELRSLNQIRDHLSEQMAKDRQLAAQLYAIERQTGVSTGTLQMSADTARRAVDSKKEQQERSRLGAVKFTAVASAIGHTTIRTMAPFLGPYAGPVGAAAAAVSPILGWGVRGGFQIGGAIKRKIGGMFGEREDESDYPSRAGGVSGASVMSLSQLRQPSLGFGHIAIDISRGLYDFFDKKAFDARWTKQLLKSTKGDPDREDIGLSSLFTKGGLLKLLGLGTAAAITARWSLKEFFPEEYESIKTGLGKFGGFLSNFVEESFPEFIKTIKSLGESFTKAQEFMTSPTGVIAGFSALSLAIFGSKGLLAVFGKLGVVALGVYAAWELLSSEISQISKETKKIYAGTQRSIERWSVAGGDRETAKRLLNELTWLEKNTESPFGVLTERGFFKQYALWYPRLFANMFNRLFRSEKMEPETESVPDPPVEWKSYRDDQGYLITEPVERKWKSYRDDQGNIIIDRDIQEQQSRQEQQSEEEIIELLKEVVESLKGIKPRPLPTAVDPNQLWYKTETDLVKSLNSNN